MILYFVVDDTATTEIYTLSLHDALPILQRRRSGRSLSDEKSSIFDPLRTLRSSLLQDRKSTRLNSSHQISSYAVFCLKKKKSADQDAAQNNSPHPPINADGPDRAQQRDP